MAYSAAHPDRTEGATQWLVLAGFIVLCLGVGVIGSLATYPNIPTWFASIEKPAFSPPNWLFAPVWTILYLLMATSAWLVWRSPRRTSAAPFLPFAVQLALNLAWSFAFFGAQSPMLGLVVIVPMWLAILWTMIVFWPLSRAAGLLLVPYLAWVTFATILNAAIYALN